jgi:hypothetical protein
MFKRSLFALSIQTRWGRSARLRTYSSDLSGCANSAITAAMMTTCRVGEAGLDEDVPKPKRGRRVPVQFSPPRKVQSFMAAPRKKLAQVQWESPEPSRSAKRAT